MSAFNLKHYSPNLPPIFKNDWKAIVILFLGLIFTVIGTFQIHLFTEEKAKVEFETIGDEIKHKIESRLYAHALILRAGSALYAVSDTVTKSEWGKFIESSKIKNNLPGILGTGFSVIIPKNELQQHIQYIQKEGFPDYTIYPDGDREIYTSIIYLEPFSDRNLRAFGYDMFSEPVRRKAMELSRDNDISMLSGKVLLVQETDEDVQTGTLMYVPVYRNGMTVNTIEQRRAAIMGWVYSPYRMNDLMMGILGKRNEISDNKIRLLIYDDTISDSSLLYDSQSNDTYSNHSPSRTFSIPVEFNGKKWILLFSQFNNELFSVNWMVIIIFLCGVFISFLLYRFLSLINKKARAVLLAEQFSAELKDKSWKLENIIHATNIGTWEWNVQSGETVFNSEWAKIIGYTLDELAPVSIKTWEANAHPDDLQKSDELLNRHFEGELPYYSYECRMKHKDGHWVWVHDYGRVLSRTSDGKPLLMFGIHTDMTKRKQAEQEIEENREKYRGLSEATFESIFISEKGICIEQNLSAEKTFGYTTDEAIGRSGIEWIAPEYRQLVMNNMLAGNEQPYEALAIKKDGTTFPCILQGKMMQYKGKAVRATSLSDITKRKQAEEEIISINKDLQKIISEKDKFFSIITHDLLSPFNTFLYFTQLMVEELPTIPMDKIQKIALNMRNSAKKLFSLLTNLLEWSQMQSGLLNFQPKSFNFMNSIVPIINSVRDTANNKMITIGTDFPEDLRLVADENMFASLMRNLLFNAIKYTMPGGEIIISAVEKQNEIIFSVSDSGIGISKSNIEKLFHIESNYSIPGTNKETGTGLGLILCKEFVEKHGGEIWVESVEGKGSVFYFTIPSVV